MMTSSLINGEEEDFFNDMYQTSLAMFLMSVHYIGLHPI